MTDESECGYEENIIIKKLVEQNLKTHFEKDSIPKRAQHGKHHGCLAAKFHIADDIPQKMQIGLFASPKRSYKALVRFSNGSSFDDRKPDAHGMAIKLLGVKGRKLQPENEDGTEHDFILVDHPVFFARSLEEYEAFTRHFTKIVDFTRHWKDITSFPRRLLGALIGMLNLLFKHWDILLRARKFASQKMNSPLRSDYWSTTPYRLGSSLKVKYSARTRRSDIVNEDDRIRSSNYLSEAIAEDLEKGRVRFDFGVSVQHNPEDQPLEDTTKDWNPDCSNFIRLATLEIPLQLKSTEQIRARMAEELFFSPWNAIREHIPIGSINCSRRAVYKIMAKKRGGKHFVTDKLKRKIWPD